MEFKEFNESEKKEWNSFVDSTPYATILQFWEWGELKRSEGWLPYRVALVAVSYTHLDGVLQASKAYPVNAVSYTHLDVYKRQILPFK